MGTFFKFRKSDRELTPSVFRVLETDWLYMDCGGDFVLQLNHLLDAGGDGMAF